MKNKLVFTFGFVISLLLLTTACSKTKSYAEMVKEENEAISRFIEEEGLSVVEEMPSTIPFADKVYYKTPEGLYIHIKAKGTPVSFSADPDKVYMEYEAYSFFKSNSTKGGAGTLPSFSYNNQYAAYGSDYLCEGMLIPIKTEKFGLGDDSRVNIIIPSKLGTSSQQSAVEPVYYEGLTYTVSPQKIDRGKQD